MGPNTKYIARRRVQVLLEQAVTVHKENPELARRYVSGARKVAMAARLRLPPDYKRMICKKCNLLLVPGYSCRVRIKPRREPHVVVTCLGCGGLKRFPLKPKRSENKDE
ncbi:MAG: hypothetical protein NWF04_00505 [Candidatus Bathyarchaeota archaeon]|nr:hypothetical protein [Candidatus Bathyarchaeota archaeon]